MLGSGAVGLLLGVSTFLEGGIWLPAALVAGGYVLGAALVAGYIGVATQKAATHDDQAPYENGRSARRHLARAGALMTLALVLLLARNALGDGAREAIFWIVAITLVAIGLVIAALSVAQRQ